MSNTSVVLGVERLEPQQPRDWGHDVLDRQPDRRRRICHPHVSSDEHRQYLQRVQVLGATGVCGLADEVVEKLLKWRLQSANEAGAPTKLSYIRFSWHVTRRIKQAVSLFVRAVAAAAAVCDADHRRSRAISMLVADDRCI